MYARRDQVQSAEADRTQSGFWFLIGFLISFLHHTSDPVKEILSTKLGVSFLELE